MPTAPQQLLVVGPNWVGDIIMANSLLQALKLRYPGCHITMACREPFHPLLKRMPEVNETLALPLSSGQLPLKILWQFCRDLAKQNFDRAYVLSPSAKYALVPWLAGIKPRLGLVHGKFLYRQLVTTPNAERLPTLNQHRLLQLVDNITEQPTPKINADKEQGLAMLAPYNVRQKSIIAFCPGAEYGPAKRWPAEHFAELANELIARGYGIVLLGSPKEKAASATIQDLTQNACINLTGKTTLVQAVDVLASVTAVIANDSGLMHIAAAVTTPVVAIYGPTDYRFTPPLASNSAVISRDLDCGPCHKRICPLQHNNCMLQILPEHVLTKLQTLLPSN